MTQPSEAELKHLIVAVEPSSHEHAKQAQDLLDHKTKPRGSLGRLEELARRICAVQGTTIPNVSRKVIVVMAADHGVAQEGVSAYPQEVTGQMVLNFLGGGAAINVLAKQAGAELMLVDMGVAHAIDAPGVRDERIAAGTNNLRRGDAMTRDQAIAALMAGARIAGELHAAGTHVVGVGEMGIANTTASSAIASVLTGIEPDMLTGRGTGIDDATRAHKVAVICDAVARYGGDGQDVLGCLASLGGFEIAGMAGLMLGAAARRITVVVDGFISSVAALVAVRMAPNLADYLVLSHASVESGHAAVCRNLGTLPLLDLCLRLGEGSGAALCMSLVDAAVAILRDMASFDTAGVTDTGR